MSDSATLKMRAEIDLPLDLFLLLEDTEGRDEMRKEDNSQPTSMQIDTHLADTDLANSYLNDDTFFMGSYQLDQQGLSSPSSPQSTHQQQMCHSPGISSASDSTLAPSVKATKVKIPRHKRQSHIKAEHKRRNKIQNGFNDLKLLVPAIRDSSSGSSKDSKASMLNKTVVYCRQLRAEAKDIHKEMESLREEIATLTSEINAYQMQLPANGASMSSNSCSSSRRNSIDSTSMVEDYIKARTFQNWKFWIFSIVMRPLWLSYNASVSTRDVNSFCTSVLNWLQNQCSLVALRPILLTTLRHLSTHTCIISKPENLSTEVLQSVIQDTLNSHTTNLNQLSLNSLSGSTSSLSSCASGYVTPGHVTPGHITPGHVTPGHITPGHVTPGHITPGHVTPGHVTPGHITPGHITPGHITPGHITPGHVTPGHVTPIHATSGHVTPGHVTPLSSTSASLESLLQLNISPITQTQPQSQTPLPTPNASPRVTPVPTPCQSPHMVVSPGSLTPRHAVAALSPAGSLTSLVGLSAATSFTFTTTPLPNTSPLPSMSTVSEQAANILFSSASLSCSS